MDVSGLPYTSRSGRRFALTLAAAFALVTAIVVWRGSQTAAAVTGGISVALLLAGLAIPGRLGPIERAWMAFAMAISRVTTPVFLGIVYFVVLTPAGWVRRTFGSNPVVHSGEDGTYWAVRPRRDAETSRRRMERQF